MKIETNLKLNERKSDQSQAVFTTTGVGDVTVNCYIIFVQHLQKFKNLFFETVWWNKIGNFREKLQMYVIYEKPFTK